MGYLLNGAPKSPEALISLTDDEEPVIRPQDQFYTEPLKPEDEVNQEVDEITYIDETSVLPENIDTVSNPAGH